jgi:hypothetical protein
MRNRMIVVVFALLAAAAFPSAGWAQRGQGGGGQGAQGGQARGGQRQGAAAEGPADAARRFGNEQAAPSVPFPPGWKPCPRCENNADRARDNQYYHTQDHPYNPHDLTGTWGWDGISNAFRDGKGPGLTEEGKKLFAQTMGDKAIDGTPLHSKDTSGRGNTAKVNCDPYGWPRLFQYNYGFEFAMFPDHIVQFFELNHTWRTIWMDGRKLPDEPTFPKWMGWNVGHWEGDTLVIESSGYEDRSWLSQATPDGGWIHSDEMKVTERWRRSQFGKLDAEITVTDPKIYTGPWTVKGTEFLVPGAELGEEFCIPSDYADFNAKVTGNAASGGKNKD